MKKVGVITFFTTLFFFGGVYMLLVFTSRMSQDAYFIAGTGLGILSVLSFLFSDFRYEKSFFSYMLGILSGLFLWAFIGEFLEHKGLVVIASRNFLPVLIICIVFLLIAILRKRIVSHFAFAFGHFLAIWALHMWMIFQYEELLRTHWSTYLSCAIAFIGGVTSLFLMSRSRKTTTKMAFSVAALLLLWTVLEYVWGWRLIPGPYSI